MLTKQFFKYFFLIIGALLFFWFFAYFKTENKPIFVPLYASLDTNNNWSLLPFIFICYYILYKLLIRKKTNLPFVFIGGFILIILINSLKTNFTLLSPLQNANDYYQDALKITDLKKFITTFDHRLFYHALHTRTHPPGPVIFHYLTNLFFGNLLWNGLIMIFLSVLTILVVYKLASVFESKRPLLNVLLILSSPAFLLYTATSMDAVFTLLITLSIYGLVSFKEKSSMSLITIFTISFIIFLALFFTYAALIIPFFTIVYLLFNHKNKPFIKAQLIIWPLVLLDYILVSKFTGFKPIVSFFATKNFNTMLMPDFFMTSKRYLFSVSANLVEFVIFLGPAIFTLLILTIKKLISLNKLSFLLKFFLALFIPMLLMNFTGVYKTGVYSGETGRIWLFLVPLIISSLPTKDNKIIKSVALISLGQTIIMALLFNFFW